MKSCLLTLAQTRGDAAVEKAVHEREGTMRSLHLLTGGNPRLIKTFYRLLAEGLRGDIRADLERLLDEFTPYFKSIVDALPVQQQRIFDAVALNWDPVDVATISRVTRVPSNQVSAQLRALVKAGHVAEPAGHPKRKRYLLADRFSNIHYLMRHGRAARSRFDWFVAILRLVFPDQAHADTLAKVARQAAECGPDGMRDARDFLHSALTRSATADARRDLIHATIRESWDNDAFNSFSEWFDVAEGKQHVPESDVLAFFERMPTALRKKLGFKPKSSEWWAELTDFLREKSAWSLAEAAFRKSLEIDPKNSVVWCDFGGFLLAKLNQPREAELAVGKAIKLRPTWALPRFGLGLILAQNLARAAEAEAAIRQARELGYDDALAHWGLAFVLASQATRIPEARACAIQAVLREPDWESCRSVFTRLCDDQPDDWRAVLPRLVRWCAENPKDADVFGFALEGFVKFARLTKPAAALAVLESVSDANAPFETLRDALLAHADRSHLDKLAPERRVVAIELLIRIAEPLPADRAGTSP
jgi:tetratricopeptide (TPR) repeat protein